MICATQGEYKMQITITLEGKPSPKAIANQLRSTANLFDMEAAKPAQQEELNVREAKPAEKVATKKSRIEEVAKQVEEFDLGDAAPVEEKSTVTIKDVIAGFQAYAKEHGREKAAKVLSKFKVKSVHDLKVDQYENALTAVEV
jgi:hypothetical protein